MLQGGSLEECRDCRSKGGKLRLRPLHAACWGGHQRVAELLVGLRASLCAGAARVTPLQLALERWKGEEKVARRLAMLLTGSEEPEAGEVMTDFNGFQWISMDLQWIWTSFHVYFSCFA